MSDRDDDARDEGATHDPEAPRKRKKRRRPVDEAPEESHDAPSPAPAPPPGEPDDPYWWTPHAVLFTLVMIGVWGFFGGVEKLGLPPSDAPKPDSHASAPAAAEPTEVGAQHLLVMHKDSQRVPPGITRSKDDARARANEALAKLKGGRSFDDVVKEYSDEPGAKDRTPPGGLGTFAKGAMVPAFSEAAFKLKVGEQSGVVETPFGYHVIKRTK